MDACMTCDNVTCANMVATELHTQCSRLSQDRQTILITVMSMTASARKMISSHIP
jgi:hypothetical protein